MYLIDSKPTPYDRHVCVIYLSRAGLVIGADGRPIEAEPSPASAAAQVAERHLTARLFPPGQRGGRSRLQVDEIQSLRDGLVAGPDMKSVAAYHESVILITPMAEGHLPAVVTEALTRPTPRDLTGITVLPVVAADDSTGEVGDAFLADLRAALPGATLKDPLVLLDFTEEELLPQLAPHLDALVR